MIHLTRPDGSPFEVNSDHIIDIIVADPDDWSVGSKSVVTTLDGKIHAVQETIDQIDTLIKGTA